MRCSSLRSARIGGSLTRADADRPLDAGATLLAEHAAIAPILAEFGCSTAARLVAGGALASSTAVEATTPPTEAPAEGHPIVGAWWLSVDEFADEAPNLVIFHADGTYVEADSDGSTGIGVWEATGPTSFNLTFVSMSPTGDGDSSRARRFAPPAR